MSRSSHAKSFTLYRFIAVTRPLSYARHKNSGRVLVTIVTTWIISVSVSSPIVLGINYTDRRSEHPTLCTFYNSDFLIYSSMASFQTRPFLLGTSREVVAANGVSKMTLTCGSSWTLNVDSNVL